MPATTTLEEERNKQSELNYIKEFMDSLTLYLHNNEKLPTQLVELNLDERSIQNLFDSFEDQYNSLNCDALSLDNIFFSQREATYDLIKSNFSTEAIQKFQEDIYHFNDNFKTLQKVVTVPSGLVIVSSLLLLFPPTTLPCLVLSLASLVLAGITLYLAHAPSVPRTTQQLADALPQKFRPPVEKSLLSTLSSLFKATPQEGKGVGSAPIANNH